MVERHKNYDDSYCSSYSTDYTPVVGSSPLLVLDSMRDFWRPSAPRSLVGHGSSSLARTLEASEPEVVALILAFALNGPPEAFTLLTALHDMVSAVGPVEHALIEIFDTGVFGNFAANISYEYRRLRRFPDPSPDLYALATVTGGAILVQNFFDS